MCSPPGPSVPRLGTPPRIVAALALFSLFLCSGTPVYAQSSRNIVRLSHLQNHPYYSACWSYVHSDGREYAIINASNGVSIVRITDPANPVEVKFFGLNETIWHEVKQYQHYIYVTTDGYLGIPASSTVEVYDMDDPDRPRHVGSFNPQLTNVHTVTIDAARGLLYLNGTPLLETPENIRRNHDDIIANPQHGTLSFGSMRIYSLADPRKPVEIGSYGQYVHDLHIRGTRGYASLIYNGVEVILDLTDPSHPVELAKFATPLRTTHSSWTSEDSHYLFVCDEATGPGGLSEWDISNLSNIRQVFSHESMPNDVPHNPRVRGNNLFMSWYSAGVRVFDLSNPAWPVEYGHFDTTVGGEGGFTGVWEVAPYYPSGIFITSNIEQGLDVYRLVPKNYGIVRGTVREGQTGPPVAGVRVVAQPGGVETVTSADGRYSLALDAPGSYTLSLSLFRFDPETRSVSNVTVGSDRTVNVSMRRSPTATITGVVSSQLTGVPLAEAELSLNGTLFQTTSDLTGSYHFDAVPTGTYLLKCSHTGYVSAEVTVTVSSTKRLNVPFPLQQAVYYDDVETDRGWTLGDPSDDAIAGMWVREAPYESIVYTGYVAQPGQDHSPAPGTMCFVTGNAPGREAQNAEVAGGKVTLTSPAISLSGVSHPRLGYWRYYTNHIPLTGDEPDGDVLTTQISANGGATWITVDLLPDNTTGWEFFETNLDDWIPGAASVRLRVIAEDHNIPQFTEALVDDIQLMAGAGGSLAAGFAAGANLTQSTILEFSTSGPTLGARVAGRVHASLALSRPSDVTLDVFDVMGRLVRRQAFGTLSDGRHDIVWDGRSRDGANAASGVYWMRVRAKEDAKSAKVLITR